MTALILRTLGALLGAATLALAAPVSAAEQDCEYRAIAHLPLSYTGPGLEVTTSGSINGKPATMLVDTGAHAVMLTQSGAQRHGLALQETSRTLQAVGGTVPVYATTVDQFAIGSSSVGKKALRVIGQSERTSPYDAVIGVPFLLQGDLEIALATKEMRLFKPFNCTHAFLAYWNERASTVSFNWGFDGHLNPRFTIYVNGKGATAMIDTGASISSISRSMAKSLGLRPETAKLQKLDDIQGWGPASTARWHASFERIQIGGEVIEHAPLSVIDHSDSMADVVLGTDFLRAYRVLIAMSQRKIYLSYVGGLPFRTTQGAEPWLEQEAESGNTDAQLRLARIYSVGEGTAPDAARAQAWLERAALAGEPHALLQTGHKLANDGQFDAGAKRMRAALDKLPGERQGTLWLYLARVRAGQAELARTELAASLPADPDLKSFPLSGFYLGKFSAEQVLAAHAATTPDQDANCHLATNMSAWYEAHGVQQRPAALLALGERCAVPAAAAAAGS